MLTESHLPTQTALDYQAGKLVFIDQRRLPHHRKEIITDNWRVVAKSIRNLSIRGAPLIGVAAALAVAAESRRPGKNLRQRLRRAVAGLRATRPTAVNLFRELARMEKVMMDPALPTDELPDAVEQEALAIWREDRERCMKIGEFGSRLLPDDSVILTICNTGYLATAGIGTALGCVYYAWNKGKRLKVVVLETRPLRQGARLTAWELHQSGIPVTVIADGAAAFLMATTRVDLCLVGADRIARNGDTVNKVGTYQLALLCRCHNIPFFVAAPLTSFDPNAADGRDIVIEMRPPQEVLSCRGGAAAPNDVSTWNPAFDLTPAGLISGFVTDVGIYKPPFDFFNLPLDSPMGETGSAGRAKPF